MSSSSSSRWGPKPLPNDDNTTTPTETTTTTTTTTTAAAADVEQPYDFQLLTQVEWGPAKDDPAYDTDQDLAPKPRRCAQDVCECSAPLTTTTDDTGGVNTMRCLDSSCVLFACLEECGKKCPAGAACGNRRLQQLHLQPVIQVFDAGLKGRGLRIQQACRAGTVLCEYTGQAVRTKHLNRLFRRYQLDRRLYIMALGDGVYLDARLKGGTARFINHSCSPNCRVERWKVRGILRAAVVALQDLRAGEELTFDYQWERKKGRAPTKCYCNSPNCRGTLEVAKSMEEAAVDKELQGHWQVGANRERSGVAADQTLVNRVVQVFSKEHGEYFLGEVTGYNPHGADGKPQYIILYRHDLSEVGEDLLAEDWMVLDDEHLLPSDKIIAKKVHPPSRQKSSPTNLLTGSLSSAPAAAAQQQPQSSAVGRLIDIHHAYSKNYLYVQTPIKEAIWSKPFFLERCERNCGVQLSVEQMARPPLAPNPNIPEEVEKYKALDDSFDGTIWKISISAGTDVAQAYEILTKSVAYWEKRFLTELQQQLQQTAMAAVAAPPPPVLATDEFIVPRLLVDTIKRKLPALLREKCRSSVGFQLVESSSRSSNATNSSQQQPHRLILEGCLVSDVQSAKEHVWAFLMTCAAELNAPVEPPFSTPRDLGCLGGCLTEDQCQLLFLGNNSNGEALSEPEEEDWNVSSHLVRSFSSTQQCTMWVERGLTTDAAATAAAAAPHKIFFGCPPKEVPRYWCLILARAKDVERGVRYYYLGADRIYQALMMKQAGRFFDYVKKVTGATVAIDSATGNHLRIDGRSASPLALVTTGESAHLSEQVRACLAEEVIRLQIELYRVNAIRESPWIFGRDWTLGGTRALTSSTSSNGESSKARGYVDMASAPQGGLDIAETVARLGLPRSVGAHAAIILYRFVCSMHAEESAPIKLREALLACVFLANKSQKAHKWHRLETVLEAGYKTLYQVAEFSPKKEEAAVLGERVIAAEAEILKTLQYDIFWRDVEWITVAATGAGEMKKAFVEDVFAFAFSGQVLSAGAELWLKYGPEYVFAASAAFLKADLEKLLPALSLIPLKVSQAAEILVDSARVGPPPSTFAPSHIMLESGKERLKRQLPRIKDSCVEAMKLAFSGQPSAVPATSVSTQRNSIIAQRSRQHRKLVGLPKEVVSEMVIPVLAGIVAESGANIFLAEVEGLDTTDIILEGHWRALAIAEHLLGEVVKSKITLGSSVFSPFDAKDRVRLQVKTQPGLINTSAMHVSDGWEGAVHFSDATASASARLGGKSCVPGKVSESSLRQSGLRWWIFPMYGPSPTGSLSDMHLVRSEAGQHLQVLASIAESVSGGLIYFPQLQFMSKNGHDNEERSIPVSLQRWPPEKVESKENSSSKSKENKMRIGVSAGALQEMQLLTQLHSVVPTPQGHPNFVLPICVAIPHKNGIDNKELSMEETTQHQMLAFDDPMVFSLFRSSEENDADKKVKAFPHIIHQPAPFILQRFISRKMRFVDDRSIGPTILLSWCHDLLSALVHCHSNHVVLRTIQPDLIVVDHAGVIKLGSLYRCTVLSAEERERKLDVLGAARSSKKKLSPEDGSSCTINPLSAPEQLLGVPKHSMESDIWSMGCLLASLLLSKPLFVAKDRAGLLQAQYKIVGAPTEKNFSIAIDLPHYTKPSKRYHRGVDRALQHMLKKEKSAQYAKMIDLIDRMIHLDPAERCTAAEALSHDCMVEYVEKCSNNNDSFRREYVRDWLDLKRRMMEPNAAEERSKKRKAMMTAVAEMATKTTTDDFTGGASGDDDDDLYDIDYPLDTCLSKKSRTKL